MNQKHKREIVCLTDEIGRRKKWQLHVGMKQVNDSTRCTQLQAKVYPQITKVFQSILD